METVTRYHDISCGHRVVGHESKCGFMHGHNYRIHFVCVGNHLDSVGRVIDFSVVKERLCDWLEDNWDHRFLAWENDQMMRGLMQAQVAVSLGADFQTLRGSIVWTTFNPTAENMARHLLYEIGPFRLQGTGVRLQKVRVDETRKCSACAEG